MEYKRLDMLNKTFLEELLKHDFDENVLLNILNKEKLDINYQDENGDSFLQICLKESKYKSALWLINHKIDLKLLNKENKNALDVAIKKDNHTLVDMMLSIDKSDINKKDKYGRTELQDVVILGQKEMAKILINHGININSTDNLNRNVLFDALSYGDKSFIDYLLEIDNLRINIVDHNHDSIMHHPKVMQNDTIALKLIEHGANTTLQDKDGKTYLCNSVLRGMDGFEVVEKALEYGSDIDSKVTSNKTILMELIDTILTLSSQEQDKRDSLYEICEYLLYKGIDVNAVDQHRQTVIYKIAYSGRKNIDLLILLLNHNANPNIKNNNDETLYEVLNNIILYTDGKKNLTDEYVKSKIDKNDEYIYVLKELFDFNHSNLDYFNSKGNPLFFNPFMHNNIELFKLYIKNGLNINNKNIDEHNLFFSYILSVFKDNNKSGNFKNNLTRLLNSKIKHNTKDSSGDTILHKIITTKCDIELFNTLTDIVLFDYKITDSMGRTAIHIAVWNNQIDIVNKIHHIDHSIINIADNYGILPITYAIILGNQELVLLFLKLNSNIKSGVKIPQYILKKFKPMLQNVDKLKDNIEDNDILRKMDTVIEQAKRDFLVI